jgi:hypothetical protein
MIEFHAIVTGLLAFVTGVLGWFARELWDAVKTLQRDLTKLEVKISSDYVSYDRLKDIMHPMIEAIEDIRDTLKSKADKL